MVIFFSVVTFNCLFYQIYVGIPQYYQPNDAFSLKAIFGCYFQWTVAVLADIFLILTLVIDPGIVARKGGRTPPAGVPAAINIPGDNGQVAASFTPPPQSGVSARGVQGAVAGMGMGGPNRGNGPTLAQATQCVPKGQQGAQMPEEEELDVHLCPVCQVHVEMFDHHCGIIGACIGRFNMSTFILFLSFACMLCLSGFFPIVLDLFEKGRKIEFGNPEHAKRTLNLDHIVPMICLACSVSGGTYTLWLALHYTLMCYQGCHSLHLRRQYIRKHWDQLSVLERQGAWPIEAYFRKGQFYNLKNCFSQMKFMRKAPIYPEREM